LQWKPLRLPWRQEVEHCVLAVAAIDDVGGVDTGAAFAEQRLGHAAIATGHLPRDLPAQLDVLAERSDGPFWRRIVIAFDARILAPMLTHGRPQRFDTAEKARHRARM
jgi:hypothetical protein